MPAKELFGCKPQIIMATFGKAVGTGGAFVAASKEVVSYLQNFARHYIYSTAFSPAHAHATLKSLQLIEQESWRREKLISNISTFKALCKELALPLLDSDSAIQPIVVGNPETALQISEHLKQKGDWVTAIRYPTVPRNTDRLRITLTSQHSHQQIETLVRALGESFNATLSKTDVSIVNEACA
jgi:8-amino-7-oxononanoate synthase